MIEKFFVSLTEILKAMGQYIQKLIAQGEHQQLDFKYCISDSKKIARSLVAFSNTDGGKLLLGVKDNGRIAGVRSDEEFYMIEAAAELFSKPPVPCQIREWTEDGKTILEVSIPKSIVLPHYAKDENGKWKAYIRVNDQNLLANTVLLKAWKRKKSNNGLFIRYTDKEKLLLDFLKENENITFNKYYRMAKIPRHIAEKILVNMLLLDIIEMQFTEKAVFYRLKNERTES